MLIRVRNRGVLFCRTTYESSNRFVAAVSSEGVVTAVANGDATVTVHQERLSATTEITVEEGVVLQSLQLSVTAITLRTAGASQQLGLTGAFSDGTTRDLTAALTGTTYVSSDLTVVSVSADGLVTAVGGGTGIVTARHEQLTADAQVTILISLGTGFLLGEVYEPAAVPVVSTIDKMGSRVARPMPSATLARIRHDSK